MGCHFLLQCMKVKSESEVVSNSSRPHGLQPSRLLRPWDLQGKSTGVGCHCLLHQVLGYSTKAQTRLGLRFVPFPGPSSSGDQVLGEHTLPRWGSVSYHLPGPSCLVFWVCSRSTISGVPCVSSGELISGSDPPGGCQPSRIPGRLG